MRHFTQQRVKHIGTHTFTDTCTRAIGFSKTTGSAVAFLYENNRAEQRRLMTPREIHNHTHTHEPGTLKVGVSTSHSKYC